MLPPAYRSALVDSLISSDNPISLRDNRRFARRGEPWLFTGAVVGVMLLGVSLVFAVLLFVQQRTSRFHGVPAALGGSYGALLAAVASACQVWMVLAASQRWCTRFFLTEYRQNTLQPLLMTTTPPFALVAQACARPLRLGLLAAVVGLPFYTLAMACGGMGWLDLLGLFILFAMLAAQVPPWQIPAFSGMAFDLAKRVHQVRRPTTWGEMWLRMGPFLLMMANGPLSAVLGPMWMMSVLAPLWAEVPRDVARMAPAFPLTWALGASRLMLTALPFYAFALPPVLLLIPMRVVGRILRIWEVSVFLRIEDAAEMAGLSDMRSYWRLRGAYSAALAIAVLGFAWQPFVDQRRTAYLVSVHGGGAGTALAGLVWMLGAWAALDTWGRLRTGAAMARAARLAGEELPGGWIGRVSAFALNCLPAWRAVAVFLVACALAMRWPAPRETVTMAAELTAVALAAGLWVRCFAENGWLYTGMLFLPLLGWAMPDAQAGSWVVACSPLSGLLCLTQHTERVVREVLPAAQAPTWWMCCAASLGCAALASLRHLLPTRRREPVSLAAGRDRAAANATVLGMLGMPSHAARTVGGLSRPLSAEQPMPEDRVAAARGAILRVPKREFPAAQRLLAAITRRTDNPLTVKEARVLLRGHLGKAELVTYAIVLLLPICLLVRYYGDVREMLEAVGGLYFGVDGIQDAGLLAGHAALWAMLLAFLVPVVAMNPCAAAFVREREKSTLAFVLCTPLKTRQVVFGKLWGATMPAWTVWLVGASWIVVTSLPVAASLGAARWLAGLALALALPMAFAAVVSTAGLLFGTLVRKENDAGGLAFLTALVTGIGGAVGGYFAFDSMGWQIGRGGMPAIAALVAAETAIALVVAPLCLGLTLWRIERARHRDISTEGSAKPA